MPHIEKLSFVSEKNNNNVVYLLPDGFSEKNSYVTVVTGRNGSKKSRVLGELVGALSGQSENSKVTFSQSASKRTDNLIICVSGTASDRFPAKELGGRPTEYDLPNYVYIGQRVGANLLSRKQPLETLLIHALDPDKLDRRSWPFFKAAFDFANIKSKLYLEFSSVRSKREQSFVAQPSLFDSFEKIADDMSDVVKVFRKPVSKSFAKFLLHNFNSETFERLDSALSRRASFRLMLSAEQISSEGEGQIDENTARLGLMCGLLRLNDVSVEPLGNKDKFSAMELSSGEFHILTTILALGFACQDDSVVLIDEPENSLHPEWQIDFMRISQEIFESFKALHVVIATHSPLIISAAKRGSCIVDMEQAAVQRTQLDSSFGMTSDGILFKNFGVTSSRNPYVVELLGQAISATELGVEGEGVLAGMREELLQVQNALPSNDPLREIIKALVEVDEEDEQN